MAGIYNETCILKSYDSNNIHMEESFFSDSSFSNDYVSIALFGLNALYGFIKLK